MAGTLYGFPFNEELFDYMWRNAPDPITTALIESGVLVYDAEIANQISKGSEVYTVPFYNVLQGTPVNYDGKTDIPANETSGGTQSGIVYGRAIAFKARDFTFDFNRADPMMSIAAQVARFWDKQRQGTMLSIIKGIFGVGASTHAGDDPDDYAEAWESHTTNIASATANTVTDANKIGATTIGDATVKACGDRAVGQFNLAIMHSVVAQNLAGTQLLEFRKYTDPMGIERTLPITDINGMTVIVYDGVPTAQGTVSKMTEYDSYVFSGGALRYAPAPVKNPVEAARDPKTNGGEDLLYTRVRETILPNGFSYVKGAGDAVSPTDAMLGTPTKYAPIFDPKCIGAVRIVSNG